MEMHSEAEPLVPQMSNSRSIRRKLLSCRQIHILNVVAFVAIAGCTIFLLFEVKNIMNDRNVKTQLMQKNLVNKDIEPNRYSQSKLNQSASDKDNLLNSDQLQDCLGSREKQTFPDIDYAFFGYNILKGYPHAIGHDPGFTYPIFEIDYSEKRQSGDCRYFLPRGLVVIPDVSCALSFSSKTVKNTQELSQALSVSTSVHGAGWGASFSASAGYKESSHEMSSGESIYIFSKAKCRYYFTKMVTEKPPPFTVAFLDWVFKLNSTNNKETYIEFFETFGTHYSTYTKRKGRNVEAAASYSGLYSAGADFKMDSSQKAAASHFMESVETKTITVGAPPPEDGKASTWASTVKDNPVPMEYNLESIENLFTKNFMSRLNVDFERIRYHIKEYIFRLEYCKHLKNTGQLDTCENVRPGFSKIKFLTNTKLHFDYKRGDSGGGMVCRDDDDENTEKLVRLVSVGLGCDSKVPSIYSKVSVHLDWINKTMNKKGKNGKNNKKTRKQQREPKTGKTRRIRKITISR
ncbi:unnamed protein product [Mytilus coruscus]|uniref:MACPF domain-containing protein n=1 Tax=Mytilus coruscus TaxID=42192 RepID=A0A6J8DZF7_MYTCO|nr:unnamed protein product [Mytilus coruscus]